MYVDIINNNKIFNGILMYVESINLYSDFKLDIIVPFTDEEMCIQEGIRNSENPLEAVCQHDTRTTQTPESSGTCVVILPLFSHPSQLGSIVKCAKKSDFVDQSQKLSLCKSINPCIYSSTEAWGTEGGILGWQSTSKLSEKPSGHSLSHHTIGPQPKI